MHDKTRLNCATVDTTEAGDGDIEVEVTYDGRPMAKRLTRSGQLYHVSFMPEGPGVYSIEIEFANMDVPGNVILFIVFFVLIIFTVRRSALHGLWDRNSVRHLSVCPSVTLVDCVHMVRHTIMILHHMVAPSF